MISRIKKWIKWTEWGKWIKSAAGTVSILLFVISIILLAIVCLNYECFSDRVVDNINNILIGLATNLLGIIVTVSFVQHFIDKQNKKDECVEENLKIKRYDRYMNVLLKRYLMHFNCVITPMEKREKSNPLRLSSQFEFEDMRDLYRQSLYMSEGIVESSIELFYKSEEKLKDYMIEMIQNIDFKYNEKLKEIIMQFIEKSIEYDMRGAVLGNMTVHSGGEGKRMTEIIMEYIEDKSNDWVGKGQRGELHSNIMLPYFQLYIILKIEIGLIEQYKNYIENMK